MVLFLFKIQRSNLSREEINKEPGSTTKNEALKTKLNPTEKLYRTGKLFFYVGVTLFIVSFTKVL